LRQSLRSTGGYVNDHDYICKCRPVDVRHVLGEIERLQAEFTGDLSQPPLEQIRAKCEQYWNEPFTLCPEEMHNVLEFIHRLTWSAEKRGNNDLR
ncbi:MAG: hypothetical protein U9N73_03770, partial [Candidatus Auribacterota bacterium]|nr:hypothetical protein [Candidatus Auribacterota bacterium]